MKANELRVGNLVLSQWENDKIHKVRGSDISSLEDGMDSEAMQPIPLTEEWLLKFGFVKHHRLIGVYTLGALEFYFVTVKGVDKKYCYVNDRGIGEKIKSVHQLQNLYFALTGEELEFSE